MKITPINKKDVLYNVKEPIAYSASMFGPGTSENGSGVKIGVVGSGLPVYKGFTNLSDFDVIVDNSDSPYDKLGRTTAVWGFIGANGDHSLTGIAPSSQMLCVKAFSDGGQSEVPEIMASILWLIVKRVDIIILPFEPDITHQVVYDTIKKAYDEKILIFSLPFDNCEKIKEINTVSYTPGSSFGIKNVTKDISISFPRAKPISAYGSKEFVKTDKAIASLSLIAGLAACLVSKAKKNKKSIIRNSVFNDMATTTQQRNSKRK